MRGFSPDTSGGTCTPLSSPNGTTLPTAFGSTDADPQRLWEIAGILDFQHVRLSDLRHRQRAGLPVARPQLHQILIQVMERGRLGPPQRFLAEIRQQRQFRDARQPLHPTGTVRINRVDQIPCTWLRVGCLRCQDDQLHSALMHRLGPHERVAEGLLAVYRYHDVIDAFRLGESSR